MVIIKVLRRLLLFASDQHCLECNRPLEPGEHGICPECIERLGLFDTEDTQGENNRIENSIRSHTAVAAAGALMEYKKGCVSQSLIHSLKYYNYRSIALTLGHAIAEKIESSPRYKHIDYIIPVPLHKKRQKKRGYNQSELIAKAISERLDVPVMTGNLVRTTNDKQQARNKLQDRKNLQGHFRLLHPEMISGKSILLLDDVFTTGATMLDCCRALKQANGITIYYVAASSPKPKRLFISYSPR